MDIVAIAEDTLLKAGVRRLPVRPTELAKVNNVAVYTYTQYANITGITVGEVAERYGSDGFSLQFGDRHVICYHFSGNVMRSRFTLAHELAHILLGHFQGGNITAVSPKCENAANHLAIELLAPTAILSHIRGLTSREIADLCDISLTAARLQSRNQYNVALSDRTQQLLQSFEQYIASQSDLISQRGQQNTVYKAKAHRL